MIPDDKKLFKNAYDYAKRRRLQVLRQESPGHGMEGIVWKTSVHSAIKAFYRLSDYETELSCYQRLQEHGVNEILGLNVPVLEGHDKGLQVIEITFVQPPYLLDFGKASLDIPPPYLSEDRKRFRSQYAAEFGERWSDVSAVLHVLEANYGIYYLDPRPQNICFDDPESDDDDWIKEPPIDYSEYE